MTDTLPYLGARAVRCKPWVWMEGMKAIEHQNPATWVRLLWFDIHFRWNGCGEGGSWQRLTSKTMEHLTPDLTDPAALGCVLALVRKAWGDPEACIFNERPGNWHLVSVKGGVAHSPTEAEALVAYYELGATSLLIRGYDPLPDAEEYGRELIPRVRELVAERDRSDAAVGPGAGPFHVGWAR